MKIASFVMSNPNLNAVVLQQCRDAAHIRLPVMVGEQHFRLDYLCRIDQLLHRHSVRLVAGEEGNVNVLDVGHFWDVLGVASDIDSQPVEGKDEAVVASLGVELQVTFGGVVGRQCLNNEIISQFEGVAVNHY